MRRDNPGLAVPSVKMNFLPTAIPGCWEIRPPVHEDERGLFVKMFHEEPFRERGLPLEFGEEFYTVTRKGALRGLHFHLPPRAHGKLVYCAAGSVLDAIVDLRRGSPAFGRHLLVELGARNRSALYLPPGVAHGFYATSEEALMVYKTTSPYSPEHDAGVRWDSCAIPWPDRSPVLSRRDREFPPLERFESPFRLEA